jgi:hypothetical protein
LSGFFIDEEMVYPAKALQSSIEGLLLFDFVVKEQGQIRTLWSETRLIRC